MDPQGSECRLDPRGRECAAGDRGKRGHQQSRRSGAIHTGGEGSFGIYAYSIGAGGGDGDGEGGNAAGIPKIPLTDQVKSLQNLAINVGGSAGATGNGGPVTVTHSLATLTTQGVGAHGIFAQSVGGGGGRGGTSSGSLKAPSISVGGWNSAGGDGGDVTVTVLEGAKIFTGGAKPGAKPIDADGASFGIFAQSVGGGGGMGGSARLTGNPFQPVIPGCDENVYCSKITFGIGIPITRPGGAGGNGGNVVVNVTGDITTAGESGAAVVAQSVGGGGGVSGSRGLSPIGVVIEPQSIDTMLWGSGSAPGSGGTVTVDYRGNIRTEGSGAHGIVAQSAGGAPAPPPPGAVAAAATQQSVGRDVKVTMTGRLEALGTDAHGIMAHSEGGEGNGNIAIIVNPDSTVSGGRKGPNNNGAGIMLKDGAANTVTNSGTITSLDKIALAHTGAGNVTVTNRGTGRVIGDILIGARPNQVINDRGGVIEADLIDVGGGTVSNNGRIAPGGDSQVGRTRIIGTLFQSPSGELGIDLDHRLRGTAGHADLLQVGGANTGVHTVTILRADDVVTTAGLYLDSAVAQTRLVQPMPHEIALVYEIDFANPGILGRTNDNADRLAGHIQAIYRAGGLDPRIGQALIGVESGDYVRVVDSFTPEVAVDNLITSLFASRRFSDGLHSCAERSGEYRFIAEGQCVWSRVQGHAYRQSATHDNVGYRDEWMQAAVGAQFAVGMGWHLGAGLAWEGHELRTKSSATSDGDLVNAGVSVKRRIDALELSGTVAGGYGSYDLRRPLAIGGVARADQDVGSVGGHVRAAYMFGGAAWFVTPRLDFGVEWVSMPSYRETWSSPFALRVKSGSDTYYTVQPAVEVGTEFAVGGGLQLRPRLTAAVTQFLGDASASVSASLAAAPAGAGTFRTRTEVDRTRFEGSIGADLFGIGGLVFRGDVFGTASGNTGGYGGSIKLEIPF